jgi:polar amino acid transport system ATP-binding protein
LSGNPDVRLRPDSTAGVALQVEGLHKAFDKLEVLRGIDLAVAEHEVVCLIGASGSGKSTLLRCVNLLEPIEAGRIVVGGVELTSRNVDVDAVRRRIGIVFQSFNLFPHMTVLENVTLAPRKALRQSRVEADAQASTLLERFGLADKRDEYPDRLSGGQQQRVAIVRALATHEMGFARDIASRVCFLDAGIILEQGPPQQIFSAPREERTKQFLQRIVDAGRL